jgi:ABC-type multidrug transport system fused ATPase/permease subunit
VKSESNIKRILWLAKPFWGKLIGISFIILLMSGINQMYPLITRSLTDLITEGKTDFLFFKRPTFVSLVILVLVLRVFSSILNRLSWYSSNILKAKLLHHLRGKAFIHLLKLSIGFYNQNQSGKTVNKFVRGTSNITSIITNVGMHFLPNMITAIISIIIVSSINLPIGIATVSMFIPFFIIRRLRFKEIEKVEKKSQRIWDKEYGHFWEVLSNIRLVKAFAAEKLELKKIYKTVRKLIGLQVKMEKINNKDNLADILIEVWTTAIISYAFYLGLIGHFTIGTVILMVQYVGMIRQPLWNLTWVFWEMKFAQIGATDYLKILDKKIDIKEIDTPVSPAQVKGEVSFNNVWFKYPDKSGQKVFSDISFKVQPGKTLALVGKSGVGKSTVAHLMVRFFDPDRGCIKIDNIDIRDMAKKGLRQNIGLVSQDSYLFDTTIAENLRYGLPTATLKQMRQACKVANALEFIDKLPKKLETVIGERGVRLSGGQKQRLSIARTILKDPKILILDEATSSLDSHSEKLVQDALWKLIKGRTAIIIAHRLSTIQKANRVLVLDKRKVAEIGSHQELLAKKGLYHQLHQLQTTQPDKLKKWDIAS